MTGHLFRQEAIDHQQERLWGECVGMQMPGMTRFGMFLFVLTLVCAGFLFTGEYRRKTVVNGMLVADKGAVQVRAPADGVVEVLRVGLGKRVGKGETLLTVVTGESRVDGLAVSDRMLAENRRQKVILQGRKDDSDEADALKRSQLDTEIGEYRDKRRRLDSLLRNENAILTLLESQFERQLTLQRNGHIASAELEQMRMDLLRQENRLQQLRLDMAGNTRALEKSQARLHLLDLDHRQQQADLDQSLSELEKERIQLQARQEVAIVSPVTGTVAVIYRQPGQEISARQPVLVIIPANSTLDAELFVPSRAVGFLADGLPVDLRLDAFPYQKFGTTGARIHSISRTVTMPAAGDNGGGVREPYYKVVAGLDSQVISAYERKIRLRPGMQLQADIVLDRRTLLEWLLEPLFIRGGA